MSRDVKMTCLVLVSSPLMGFLVQPCLWVERWDTELEVQG